MAAAEIEDGSQETDGQMDQRLNEFVKDGNMMDMLMVGAITGLPHGDVAGMNGDSPVSRFDHAVAESEGKIYILGGRNKTYECLNDTWCYGMFQPAMNEMCPMPEERGGHSVVHSAGELWVFGGSDGAEASNKLYKYSISEDSWEDVEAANAPPARFSHGVGIHEKTMTIFGGSSVMRSSLNDLWSLNMETLKWVEHHLKKDDEVPSPRTRVVATRFNETFLIHGGFQAEYMKALDDVWEYSMDTKTWRQPEVSGQPPPGLVGHNGIRVGDSWMLFGGMESSSDESSASEESFPSIRLWELNLKSFCWRYVNVVDTAPSPWGFPTRRYAAASVFVPEALRIVMVGGYTHTDGKNPCPTSSFACINLLPSLTTLSNVENRFGVLEDAVNMLDAASDLVKNASNTVEEVAAEISRDSNNPSNTYARAMDPELEKAVHKIVEDLPVLGQQVDLIAQECQNVDSDLASDSKAVNKLVPLQEYREKRIHRLDAWVNELQGLADVLKDVARPPEVEEEPEEAKEAKDASEETEEEPKEPPPEVKLHVRMDDLKPKLRKDGDNIKKIERAIADDFGKAKGLNDQRKSLNETLQALQNDVTEALPVVQDIGAKVEDLRASNTNFKEENPIFDEVSELKRRIDQIHCALQAHTKSLQFVATSSGQVASQVGEASLPSLELIAPGSE